MKRRNLLFIALAALLSLSACNNGKKDSGTDTDTGSQTDTSTETDTGTETGTETETGSETETDTETETQTDTGSTEKVTPTITIDLKEDTEFDVAEDFSLPTITVTPSDAQYNVTFTSYDGQSDLGKDAPVDIGDYAIKVTTVESDKYEVATKSVKFFIRQFYTISFKANDEALENGAEFALGTPVTISTETSVGNLTPSKIEYTKDEGATVLGDTFPTELGTYAVNAYFDRTERYASASAFRWFKVVSASRVTPVVTIKYGNEANTENGTAGQFTEGSIPDFSYSIAYDGQPVTDATVEAFYQNEANEQRINKEDMVAGGKYSYHVNVTADDKYTAVIRWVWFTVISASKVTPVVTIKYGDEANTENGPAGSFVEGSIPDFSYSISADGAVVTDATVDAFYQEETGYTRITKDQMVAGGTYSYHVNVIADSKYNAVERWVWFTVTAASQVNPVVTIKYGDETNTENGGVGNFVEGSIPDFSYSIAYDGEPVTDATVDAFYQNNNTEKRVTKDQMVAGGTYSYNVKITEDDKYTAVVRWVWFTVSAASVNITVTDIPAEWDNTADYYGWVWGANDTGSKVNATLDGTSLKLTVADDITAFKLVKVTKDAEWVGGESWNVNLLAESQQINYVKGTTSYSFPVPETGYGVKINNETLVKASHLDEKDGQGRDQYKVERLDLKEGDYFKLYNYETQAEWVVTIENENISDFIAIEDGKYVVKQDFVCDIYIKLLYENDRVWISIYE